jgi:hypothetical protein
MKKLREIVEATKSLHPMALHVKPVAGSGGTKYQVHAVGKHLADGIKVGEHLTDTHLDDAADMGAKIKHVKESVNEGKMSELDMDLKTMKDKDFETHYGKPKSDFKPTKKPMDKPKSSNVKEEVQIDELKASTVAKYQDKAFNKYMGGDDKRAKGLDRANKKQVGAMGHLATTKEETDFGPEADKNITVQLKKAMDMMEHGEKSGSEIEFADGQKYFVEGIVAYKVLEAMEQMKPEVRAQAQNAVYQSFAHLIAAHQMLSK